MSNKQYIKIRVFMFTQLLVVVGVRLFLHLAEFCSSINKEGVLYKLNTIFKMKTTVTLFLVLVRFIFFNLFVLE